MYHKTHIPRSPGGDDRREPLAMAASASEPWRDLKVITTVIAPDGRRLTVESWGASHGVPVFMLHGTPGSRRTPHPKHAMLYRQGVHLISYDRPGYGDSDPLPDRDVAHAAADVAAIADALEIGTFSVFGRSGGGPHALACAALMPYRVTRVAALGTLAPRDAENLDWYKGMADSNVAGYRCAELGYRRVLAARLDPRAARIRDDPISQLPFNDDELPKADKRVVADYGIRSMLVDSFADAVKSSSLGWMDDMMAFTAPWGFDVGRIDCPVLLWHGELDTLSPVGHAKWLARRITGAKLVVEPGAAHFGALVALPDVINWLAESSAESSTGQSAGTLGAAARGAGPDQVGCGSSSRSTRSPD
jgi:pimeloyl-ACP methyl ester carboxylesterase